MQVHSVEAIIGGWNAAGVRYMIAGGLAVVAYGYNRLTVDVDAILEFEPENLSRALCKYLRGSATRRACR